jgi:broad specificity phosphatase PhoE
MPRDDVSRKRVYLITHPDVVVDPNVPVPRWPLSARGLERMRMFLTHPFVPQIGSVYCSTEQKAIDAAAVLAAHCGVDYETVEALGENDRSSTGYLPAAEFQATADLFFAQPEHSVRGWETAAAAQRRIAGAVEAILARDTRHADVALVSHGGVAALFLCHLKRTSISRAAEQPGTSGGNYYAFDAATRSLLHGWKPIDGSGPA